MELTTGLFSAYFKKQISLDVLIEEIVTLLQKICSEKSIKYLYDAIELHPQYLEWDDNYAFEVKCVRAIYHIGKEKSFSYLEELCEHPNAVIREMAQRQLKKLQ